MAVVYTVGVMSRREAAVLDCCHPDYAQTIIPSSARCMGID